MTDHGAVAAITRAGGTAGTCMQALLGRWPGLAVIPRIPLVRGSTPLTPLVAVSRTAGVEVWCKRDDLTADAYGGNKARKLEFLLGAARAEKCETLVTTGAAGSNHVLATAIHGRAHGFLVHAVLSPQTRTPHAEENLRAIVSTGAEIHHAPGMWALDAGVAAVTAALKLRGHRAYPIPAGGSTAVGTLGYVAAAAELVAQLDGREAPEPDSIFIPFGTGGTLAGLAVGLAACGSSARIVGVRVTDRRLSSLSKVEKLIDEVVAILREADPTFPDVRVESRRLIDIDEGELGRGYGIPTPHTDRAIGLAEHDGLHLEHTYTSRSLASLLRKASNGEVRRPLFVLTLSSAVLPKTTVVDLPGRLQRLLVDDAA